MTAEVRPLSPAIQCGADGGGGTVVGTAGAAWTGTCVAAGGAVTGAGGGCAIEGAGTTGRGGGEGEVGTPAGVAVGDGVAGSGASGASPLRVVSGVTASSETSLVP